MSFRHNRSFRRSRRYALVRRRKNYYYYNNPNYDKYSYYSRRRSNKKFNRPRHRKYWFKKKCQNCERKVPMEREMKALDKELNAMSIRK